MTAAKFTDTHIPDQFRPAIRISPQPVLIKKDALTWNINAIVHPTGSLRNQIFPYAGWSQARW